ncbi:MAG: LTA synthase family protein [bacterium]|nr:LTA synthase family protein [bacterium]
MKPSDNPRSAGMCGRTRSERWSSWLFWLGPLMTTPLLYWLFSEISFGFLDIRLKGTGWRVDLLLHVAVAYLLLTFSRRFSLFLLSQILIMGTLFLGSSVKIAFWGWPLRPEDLAALPELIGIVDIPSKVMILGPVITAVVLVVWNFRFRAVLATISCVVVASIVLSVVIAPARVLHTVDRNNEHTEWNQVSNFCHRGAALYLVTEVCRTRLNRPAAPSESDVAVAVDSLRHKPESLANVTGRRRSLYLVVLESFWDASQLVSAEFDRHPLHPDFLDLWNSAGNSVALSGEFGGATANPEFEILCGIPSKGVFPAIVFNNSLTNDVPCLPRILSLAGWNATAFHANVPDFWNRRIAYEHLGFSKYVSKSDFVLKDRNGRFLSDEASLHQAEEWMDDRPGSESRFAYILTISGHWPYDLADRRPRVIQSTSDIPEVSAFANSLWYSSKELVGFINEIQRDEPDALIVALGDHLPNLGAKLEAFRESNLISKAWIPGMSPVGLRHLTAVPLLIIDGENGPLPIGTIAQYEIPSIVLDLLGLERPPWMDLFLPQRGRHIRPFGEILLIADSKDQWWVCRGNPEDQHECAELDLWIDDVRTIAFDLTFGDQEALDDALVLSDPSAGDGDLR